MNYGDFSNPKGGYLIDNTKYFPTTTEGFISEVIRFSQSVKLWNRMIGPSWEQNGFNDIDIDFNKNVLKYDRPLSLFPPRKGVFINCSVIMKRGKERFKGQTDFNEKTGLPEQIILDSSYKTSTNNAEQFLINEANDYNFYTIPSFAQILFLELGNFKNWENFKELDKIAVEIGSVEYVKRCELLEFNIRNQIIETYNNGGFESPKYKKQNCIFKGGNISFNEYLNSSETKQHSKKYEDQWWKIKQQK